MSSADTPDSIIPVRTIDTFERDGRRVVSLRVFCPRQERSIDPKQCAACSFASSVSNACVVCAVPRAAAPPDPFASLFLGPDASGRRTPLGEVCSEHVITIRVGAAQEQLRWILEREPFVVVLREDDRVAGVLSDRFQAHVRGTSGARVEPFALIEQAPLSEAIDLMVHAGLRAIPIVDRERRFIGAVTDIDVLRWAMRQRVRLALLHPR